MKKSLLPVLIVLFSTAAFAVAGCSKAPLEKVSSLEKKIESIDRESAEYFAADEYKVLMRQLDTVKAAMNDKKYGRANAVADSAFMTIDNVRATFLLNGRKAAKENMAAAKKSRTALLGLLNDNFEALDKIQKVKTYEEIYQGFNTRYAALETDLNNSRLWYVYNEAKKLTEEIETASESVKTELTKQ